jgi:hypothetical protein
MSTALNVHMPGTANHRLSETSDSKAGATRAALVGDRRFWQQLQNLRELKSFLFSEGVVFKEDDLAAIQLGELDVLAFSQRGRMPSIDEWRQIDAKMNALAKYLDTPLRRKRIFLRLRLYFRTYPLLFLFLAIVSLFITSSSRYFIDGNQLSPLGTLIDFTGTLMWVLALGGLGAFGYLGTSLMAESRRVAMGSMATPPAAATSGQSGVAQPPVPVITPNIAEIDLTDANLIVTRIVVGMVFSFILGFPVFVFSGDYGVSILHMLILGKIVVAGTDIKPGLATIIGLLLVPFVLGFSTTLVLGIMDRFVTAAGNLFGFTTTH